MKKLEFFWDVGSPYTYLASTQLAGLRARTGVEIQYRPFLLGGVFKAVGNRPPAALAHKAKFMLEDLGRWARQYGVELKLPPEVPFPINTLIPMRTAVAAETLGKGVEFCDAVFARYWREGHDVSRPEQLASVIQGIGLDPAEVASRAQSQPAKDRLRENSDEAIRRGAFGAPTFFVGDAMFFGNDRLGHVEAALSNV